MTKTGKHAEKALSADSVDKVGRLTRMIPEVVLDIDLLGAIPGEGA